MIGRIFSILKALWSRPAVQASVWMILESIVIWLKDWIVVFFKRNSPCNTPKTKDYTPGESKNDKKTTQRAPRRKRQDKKCVAPLATPKRRRRTSKQ